MPRRRPPRTAVAIETLRDGALLSHAADGTTDRVLGGARRTLAAAAASVLLPAGDLPPDYFRFQLFDSLQALTSYVRGVVASASVLRGLGVGNAAASALSATAAWLARDAAGLVFGLAFTGACGSSLDADCKAWRLAADVANDAALTLDAVSPLLPAAFFAPCVALASVARSLCGTAGGATRAALTAHFARARGAAAADVASKEASQETLVTLVGMGLGYVLARAAPGAPAAAAVAFTLLTIAHVWLNAAAVRSVALTTLNAPRASLALRAFVASGRVPGPAAAAAVESLLPPPLAAALARAAGAPRVTLGAPLADVAAAAGSPVAALVAAAPPGATHVAAAAAGNHSIVALAADATPRDVLRAYCHGLLLAGACGADLAEPAAAAAALESGWERFESALEAAGWALDALALVPGGARFMLAEKRD